MWKIYFWLIKVIFSLELVPCDELRQQSLGNARPDWEHRQECGNFCDQLCVSKYYKTYLCMFIIRSTWCWWRGWSVPGVWQTSWLGSKFKTQIPFGMYSKIEIELSLSSSIVQNSILSLLSTKSRGEFLPGTSQLQDSSSKPRWTTASARTSCPPTTSPSTAVSQPSPPSTELSCWSRFVRRTWRNCDYHLVSTSRWSAPLNSSSFWN